MSTLETLELQILNAVIPAGEQGRSFDLPQLKSELGLRDKSFRETPSPAAEEEMIAALVDLCQMNCIMIRHHVDGGTRRREGSETLVLFYRGSFTCTRQLPEALKSRDKLRKAQKHGVFISHNVPESGLAVALKEFLRAGRGQDYPVFVSSDLQSIQTGREWFTTVVETLRKAEVVLVVVTPQSFRQPWLNFEAGIGVGSDVSVMPLLTRGFGKSDFRPPLSQLQARDLANRQDFDC